MKFLLAPDSFKGSLTADKAAEAMARGIRRILPDAGIIRLPLADGGEGTMRALVDATDGKSVPCRVSDPLGQPINASYGLLGHNGETAVVDMASAAGLTLVAPEHRNPLVTTTYGVGQLLSAAAQSGPDRIIVGIGGSATNDGGLGAMQALGVRFLDRNEIPLPDGSGGGELERVAWIDASRMTYPVDLIPVTVACDVTNSLTGPNGASLVYGPQKGADLETALALDTAMRHYSVVLKRDLGVDVADLPGAGAAGGLGAALMAFLRATLVPGIEVVLDVLDFDRRVADADWIFTGEGSIDLQTLNGKAICGVLNRAIAHHIPVIAFGGVVDDNAVNQLRSLGLHQAVAMSHGDVSPHESMRHAAALLERAVMKVVEQIRL